MKATIHSANSTDWYYLIIGSTFEVKADRDSFGVYYEIISGQYASRCIRAEDCTVLLDETLKPGVALVTIQYNGKKISMEFDAQEIETIDMNNVVRFGLGIKRN